MVYVAGKQQCTEVGREVPVPWGCTVFTVDRRQNKEIDTEIL